MLTFTASKLGNVDKTLTMHLGISFIEGGDDDSAKTLLNQALGNSPDKETLEEISNFLESKGAFTLAQYYRRMALYKDLEKKDSDEDDKPN